MSQRGDPPSYSRVLRGGTHELGPEGVAVSPQLRVLPAPMVAAAVAMALDAFDAHAQGPYFQEQVVAASGRGHRSAER